MRVLNNDDIDTWHKVLHLCIESISTHLHPDPSHEKQPNNNHKKKSLSTKLYRPPEVKTPNQEALYNLKGIILSKENKNVINCPTPTC